MDTMIIKPMDIVAKFQPKPLQVHEIATMHEFCFEYLKCRFCHRIVVWTAFQAQRSLDLKCGQNFVNKLVVKFTAAICMEQLNLTEIRFHGCKCVIDEICIFVGTGTVTDDFAVKEVHQDTDVIPFVVDSDIRQVADNNGVLALTVELPVQFVRNGRFVAFSGMHLEPAFRIG